jgi:hypothetical protein
MEYRGGRSQRHGANAEDEGKLQTRFLAGMAASSLLKSGLSLNFEQQEHFVVPGK